MNFADKLHASILRSKSFICAGIDPQLESFPKYILEQAQAKHGANEDAASWAICEFYSAAIEAIHPHIAAIKPNIAFFEQYGAAGLQAFKTICALGRRFALPVIGDAKRGDIGSTAKAYSSAFLGRVNLFGTKAPVFDVDALTVNPYLGFDTLEPFIEDAKSYGKGLFVLVKTSNPGSSDIQGLRTASNAATVTESVAQWIASHSDSLVGACGYSGLGAVVGATYPDEARGLRRIMPKNFFLIPGFGAQGAGAAEATAGFSAQKRGAIINASRGIFSGKAAEAPTSNKLREILLAEVSALNKAVAAALL